MGGAGCEMGEGVWRSKGRGQRRASGYEGAEVGGWAVVVRRAWACCYNLGLWNMGLFLASGILSCFFFFR